MVKEQNQFRLRFYLIVESEVEYDLLVMHLMPYCIEAFKRPHSINKMVSMINNFDVVYAMFIKCSAK